MKKFIYCMFTVMVALVAMSSCKEEGEGTVPGTDSQPSVLIYSYPASRPNNPDNDVVLRFATNSAASETYYLVEKTTEKEAHVTSMGESGYWDYVVSNGTKLEGASGASNIDVTLTDLYGDYTITAVAVNGNQKKGAEATFSGLDWTDVVEGTYYFEVVPSLGLQPVSTVLQVCTSDPDLYRFKDVFGEGYSMKINLINLSGSDEDGTYRFFRVPVAETPYTYGDYGAVSVRDIGYWQGNDAFVTEYGYESGMYEDYYCFIFVQYYVSAGNLGYNYDFFVPAE